MVYRVVSQIKGSCGAEINYHSFNNLSDAIIKGKNIIEDWMLDMKTNFNSDDCINWSVSECFEWDNMLDTHSVWIEEYDEIGDECGNTVWSADEDDSTLDMGWVYTRY